MLNLLVYAGPRRTRGNTLDKIGAVVPEMEILPSSHLSDHVKHYNVAIRCIEELALHLKPVSTGKYQ
jgi:hypothetical protein